MNASQRGWKVQPAGPRVGRGHHAADRAEPLPRTRRAGLRDRAQQRLRVRVLRVVEERVDVRPLGDGAEVHDRDLVGDLGDDAQVVRDEHDRHAELVLQLAQQLEDLRLRRHVERGRRLVGDQQVGLAGERRRDHRPLPHAAAKLERIGVHQALPGSACRRAPASRSRGPRASSLRPAGAAASPPSTWSPTVCTGLSEVIGSWKIIAISLPRISRMARRGPSARRCRRPRAAGRVARLARPAVAAGSRRRRSGPARSTSCRIEWAVTLLPQPLSPTTQSVCPRRTSRSTPSTALTTPSRTKKCVRSCFSSRTIPAPGAGKPPPPLLWRLRRAYAAVSRSRRHAHPP